MAEDYQRLIRQMAELKRQMSNMFQTGTVSEVKKDKMRMVIGKDADGKEILSPWLNTAGHRGGATEAKFYKKGQTISMLCPNGDIRQGMIAPFAPNKDFKRPEHADDSGQDEESYQLDDYRAKQTKEGYDNWLQPDDSKKEGGEQSGGGGGGGGQQQKKKGHTGGDKAVMKTRMNKDGGITHRVGKDSRVAAAKDGAKLRMGSDWVVVTKGKIIFSQPPVLEDDPIKNDDK
jgi:hypothetical protein